MLSQIHILFIKTQPVKKGKNIFQIGTSPCPMYVITCFFLDENPAAMQHEDGSKEALQSCTFILIIVLLFDTYVVENGN